VPVSAERSPLTTRVGEYQLFAEIASGGMATVHLGYRHNDPHLTAVAIKRLHSQFTRDLDFVTMFFDEARLVTQIQHPNVVPTFDVVQSEHELSLVMQYVHGEAFSKLLGSAYRLGKPASPAIVRTVMVDVLRGLHAAHETKDGNGAHLEIVHRDVSPHNIIVSTDGVARILDFGIAKAVGKASITRDNEVRGKIAYMAPEQLQRTPVNQRTDIYAAAIVMWEALACKRLFHSDSDARTLARVMTLEVSPPSHYRSGISPELDAAVLRGLARDPSLRFQTAIDFSNAILASGPCASRHDLGAWVQMAAAERLDERARLVTQMRSVAIRGQQESAHIALSAQPQRQQSSPPSTLRTFPPISDTVAPTSRRRRTAVRAAITIATLAVSLAVGAWLSTHMTPATTESRG
jgi:eukaryotic-like serine/threonine-protein kinase